MAIHSSILACEIPWTKCRRKDALQTGSSLFTLWKVTHRTTVHRMFEIFSARDPQGAPESMNKR